jgi:hypothetical protein
VAVVVAAAPDASAFELEGHAIIEAAAYKRLLALPSVPGAGVPGLSGRALLASLIAGGVLDQPPCFDRASPSGDCDAARRLDLPLLYWPQLHAGAPDLVIDRQLGERGQCQHFMAHTGDGLTPVDPRLGVPAALAADAYLRCTRVAGAVFDLILRDPQLAQWRLAGTYVLMHAVQDSFSAAHVNRTPRFQIVHLLSWTLIDWPAYLWHGLWQFPAATHHAVSDRRDAEVVRRDGHAADGRACPDFHHPYAVPEECLTDRGKAAVGAVVDLLIALYRARLAAGAHGEPASLFSPSGDEAAVWRAFVGDHLASVSVPPELPDAPRWPLRRPDVFMGVRAVTGSHFLGAGLWGGKLFLGPAAPFALGLMGGAGYVRADGSDQLVGAAHLVLVLPLVRRFAVGAAPVGVEVVCDAGFTACKPDLIAGLGVLLVPLGDTTWLGVQGPSWSWTERALGRSLVALSVGWSHEWVWRRAAPGTAAATTWDPPPPDQVRAYRSARSTRAVYLATTLASQPENTFVGAGLAWRLDRDVWDRRAGLAPGLEVEIDGGRIEQPDPGGALAVAPTLRWYLWPDRLGVDATPALVRAGALAGQALAVDVAARAGVVLEVGRLELAVDSPPISYVSAARRHPLPLTVRLGVQLN